MTISSVLVTVPLPPKRILVVDDESNQAYLLRTAIRKMPGTIVQTAASAEQALLLCEQQPFDLLLTDYLMTGMNGLELAARVHALSPRTAIVMLTAFANPEMQKQAQQIPVFRVMDKPAEIGEIRQTVQAALDLASRDANPTDDDGSASGSASETASKEHDMGDPTPTDFANLRRRRILVVEDEGNQAFVLRSTLRKLPNSAVLTAASGEQALRLFQQEPFDLLVTDFKLSGMDGLRLAQQVRDTYPRTPIIMLTAFGDDTLREKAERVPIRTVLDKPAGVDEIRHAALEALEA